MMTLVVVSLVIFAGLSLAFLTLSSSNYRSTQDRRERRAAFYAAEAGLSEALAVVRASGRPGTDGIVYPQSLGGPNYSVTARWGEDSATMGDDLVAFVCRSSDNDSEAAIEMLLRIGSTGIDSLPWGVFGKRRIRLDSNSMIDSYDSSLGSYASQVSGSFSGTSYARSNAPVGSNGDIELDSNSSIRGDATPGPGDSVSSNGGSQVTGSTLPSPEDVTLPPVDVPTIAPTGSMNFSSGTRSLASGDHHLTSLNMTSTARLNITGPANVVIGNAFVDGDSRITVDATAGRVVFYVLGDYEQNSNTRVGPSSDDPMDLVLLVNGAGSDVLFDSNTRFTGAIYAPDRDLEINSNSEVWGPTVADRITLDSNARIHFDENVLRGAVNTAQPLSAEVISWRPVALDG